MRFSTSDPDVATIFRRIEREKIDLQPEFQRGDVWAVAKKQRLIDSILRRWHVPPIHLVSKGDGEFDVLDGQQRLTAIRDFVRGLFVVDGSIEPMRAELAALDQKRYGELPDAIRDQFDSFPIRIFELDDYEPDEPHELFFRLNQPTNLTEAEKRNAFIGAPRNQVRTLVGDARAFGMTPQRIGFSNARMAYDDLIARFLITVEQQSLNSKVTAQRITSRYRTNEPFAPGVIEVSKSSLQLVVQNELLDLPDSKPNKATVHTWLCMAAELTTWRGSDQSRESLRRAIAWIEAFRGDRDSVHANRAVSVALTIFNDRSTARVADVASVVLRDISAWIIANELFEAGFSRDIDEILRDGASILREQASERNLLAFAQSRGWGKLEWI